MRCGARAFTLAELLAALAIIGMLAALLFPVIGRLRRASDNARCIANLRMIGQQSLTFFQERNGDLFPVWNWHVHEPFLSLLGIEKPYSGADSFHDSVLTCPGFKRAYPVTFPHALNRSYSLNRWAHQYDVESMQGSETNKSIFPGNLYKVRKPSAMWMFMDGAVVKDKVGGDPFTYYNINMGNYMGRPHADGTQANAVFFDGHVEPVTLEMYNQYYTSDFWGAEP